MGRRGHSGKKSKETHLSDGIAKAKEKQKEFCVKYGEIATHSSILAWKIAWTEEPGGLQSMGSQRVRQD